MNLDALAGKIYSCEIKAIHKGSRNLAKIEQSAGLEQSQKFETAIYGLFGIENGKPLVEITDRTQLDNMSQPIMAALSAGFEMSHKIAKELSGGDVVSHQFLDAMSFLNRKEPKYAQNFFNSIKFMSEVAQIQATRDFYKGFEGIREKQLNRQGLAIQKNEWFLGLWKTYRNWGGSGLFQQMEVKVDHARELSKFIINKASLAVK
jgi:hypothetical protein